MHLRITYNILWVPVPRLGIWPMYDLVYGPSMTWHMAHVRCTYFMASIHTPTFIQQQAGIPLSAWTTPYPAPFHLNLRLRLPAVLLILAQCAIHHARHAYYCSHVKTADCRNEICRGGILEGKPVPPSNIAAVAAEASCLWCIVTASQLFVAAIYRDLYL